ncbi:MAG TPA: hypothetical protein VHH36_09385 [Candidatus Thermoplasmatota archaeon]|nr:hypothetical protein [Candidatus Thermoplasmatota archaeon]
MHLRRLLLPALLVASVAHAGGPDDPEVADPVGDVQALGAPAPVPLGLEWADLRAAWFEADGENLKLTIQVGDGQGAPPQGEIGVTFRVGERHFIAGYTVVPGLYSGGFVSEADANGDVPASVDPQGVDGAWADGLVTTTFPKAAVDANGTIGSLGEPWGWSESMASNGERYRLDRTDVGRAFAWGAGNATSPGTETVPQVGGEKTPAPAPALVAAAVVAVALLRARRA